MIMSRGRPDARKGGNAANSSMKTGASIVGEVVEGQTTGWGMKVIYLAGGSRVSTKSRDEVISQTGFLERIN